MFAWLTNRRSIKSQALDLLSQTQVELTEGHALCKRWIALYESQSAQLTAARAENACLRTALGAPAELQPYIAAGCSEAEARQLARQAPRGA